MSTSYISISHISVSQSNIRSNIMHNYPMAILQHENIKFAGRNWSQNAHTCV